MTLSKENQQAIRANYEVWTQYHLKLIGKLNDLAAGDLIQAHLGVFEHSRHIGMTAEQTAREILGKPKKRELF